MLSVRSQFQLNSLNTLQLNSVAESYTEIHSEEDLRQFWQQRQAMPQPLHILGGGSNLVLSEFIPGTVVRICTQGKRILQSDSNIWLVESYAGENWHAFVQWTLQQGYHGLENLSLIPGTVGAAPIQNIGAYGVEVKDLLDSVTCFDLEKGDFCTFSNQQCNFSYRDSLFKQEGAHRFLIWSVRFQLPKSRPLQLNYGDIRKEVECMSAAPTAVMVAEAVIKIRRQKLPDPQLLGNVGSFFKNPIVSQDLYRNLLKSYPNLVAYPAVASQHKLAAGWLIEQAGWKGKKLGPVGMYEKQALVLVNHGHATSTDVWKLAQAVCLDVEKKFGVRVEPEPIRW
jgi:UDP-N-acetylmuramate dehydrogenase